MLDLREINGKLHRIVETRIDQFNTKREAIPVTEEEFAEFEELIAKQHSKEKKALISAKEKGSLTKKADLPKDDKGVTEEAEVVSTPVVKRGKQFSLKH